MLFAKLVFLLERLLDVNREDLSVPLVLLSCPSVRLLIKESHCR
jgi:hypothetical protein